MVVALIGVPMFDMIKATKMRWWSWVLMISTMILVCVLKVSPIYILICVIAGALGISWHINKRNHHGSEEPRNDREGQE